MKLHINYISKLWSYLQKLMRSKGEGYLLTGKMLLLILLQGGCQEGRGQDMGQVTVLVKPVHNYKQVQPCRIHNFVKTIYDKFRQFFIYCSCHFIFFVCKIFLIIFF